MKLSKRLALVASFVPEGKRLADVGTDHGYIPIYVTEEKGCPGAVAMDVGKGPLKRAQDHIREHGLEGRIETRLSDGLAALVPGEAEVVVIAGMGGELMLRILEEGRHMWGSVELFVLSPQSELDKVRWYLEENFFSVEREDMVLDEGKYYTVMGVRWNRGGAESGGCAEFEGGAESEGGIQGKPWWYLYGKRLIQEKNPVLRSFLEEEEKRLTGILRRLNGQESERAAAAVIEIEEQIAWLREAQEEMGKDEPKVMALGS